MRLPLQITHSGSPPLKRPGMAILLVSRAKANSAPHAVRVAWQLESAAAACSDLRTHEFRGERCRINM